MAAEHVEFKQAMIKAEDSWSTWACPSSRPFGTWIWHAWPMRSGAWASSN